MGVTWRWVLDRIVDGTDGYVSQATLDALVRDGYARRWWSHHQIISTVEAKHGGYYRSRRRWLDHPGDRLGHLLEDAMGHGITRPTSYADLAVQSLPILYRRQRFSRTHPVAGYPRGGWQAVAKYGRIRGPVYVYDLNRAYLSAALAGLPDPRTYAYSRNPWEANGCWLVRLRSPSAHWPGPLGRRLPWYLLSSEERDTLQLGPDEIGDVRWGMTWAGQLDTRFYVRRLETLPAPAQVARSYWGPWIGRTGPTCHTPRRTWQLPAVAYHPVWAHLITSRIRLRIWEVRHSMVHCYVDSVIVRRPLPTGDGLGDWRLEATYPDGVVIHGPGRYGPPDLPLVKHAGTVRG